MARRGVRGERAPAAAAVRAAGRGSLVADAALTRMSIMVVDPKLVLANETPGSARIRDRSLGTRVTRRRRIKVSNAVLSRRMWQISEMHTRAASRPRARRTDPQRFNLAIRIAAGGVRACVLAPSMGSDAGRDRWRAPIAAPLQLA